MAVDDLEPLTATEDEGEDLSCRHQDNIERPNSGDKFNALLTSALHKHASNKLGKKKLKSKEIESTVLGSEGVGKRIKDDGTGKSKSEKVELVEVHQDNDKINQRNLTKKLKRKGKIKEKDRPSSSNENLAIISKSISKERLIETEEKVKNLKDSKIESTDDVSGHENEEIEEKAEVCKESPTKAYLREVAVPKTKKNKKKLRRYKDSGVVLSLIVHCADRLEGSLFLMPHPVIQIHICNAETGHWLCKSQADRRVTSFYEGPNVDYILPIMTKPYDIKKNRSLYCRWEEEIIFNEDVEHFQRNDPQTIIFFQLMDFPGSSGTNQSNINNKEGKGWTTFAWAFLKVVGANNHKNIGQRLRLQLWRPKKSTNIGLTELYSWWISGSRIHYPSTLYVTLLPTTLQQDPPAAVLRSTVATQAEQGRTNLSEPGGSNLKHLLDHSSSITGSNNSVLEHTDMASVEWDRKPNQSCKIPNLIKHHLSLESGSLIVKFNHNGIYLACGVHKDVMIYNIISGQLLLTLDGHFGLIYDITWSANDNLLLTASADATARVWNFEVNDSSNESQVLAHPSYVYVARFVPGKWRSIVTGCYDHVIRVWSSHKGGSYKLIQELTDHLGFVSALCFSIEGNTLYSGDKQGVILVWNIDKEGKKDKQRFSITLTLVNEIKLNEIVGSTINALESHPSGHRLLVHTRDSQLRFVNHNHWTITHRLRGLLNVREQLRGCISPCGQWVISGSEDQGVYVWNTDSGEMVSAFMDLPLEGTTSCIDFHPHANVIAISSYSAQAPVLILSYDETSAPVNTSIPRAVLPATSATNVQSMSKNSSQNTTPRNNAMDTISARSHSPNSPSKSPRFHKIPTDNKCIKYDHISSTMDKNKEFLSESSGLEDRSHRILSKLDTVLRLAAEDPLKMNSNTRSEGQVKTIGHVMRAQYDYNAMETDELSLKKGDFVVVIEKNNSEWWTVQNAAGHQQRGIVPSTYLQEINTNEQEMNSQSVQVERSLQQPDDLKQRYLKNSLGSSCDKVIAVPSSSGEVSFIIDIEGTSKKSRARQRRRGQRHDSSTEQDIIATHKSSDC